MIEIAAIDFNAGCLAKINTPKPATVVIADKNIEDLKEECKIWITTILDKFDSSKGSKAFSYFSVITKNWFIHKVKKVSRQNKKELFLDDAEHQKEFDYDNLILFVVGSFIIFVWTFSA